MKAFILSVLNICLFWCGSLLAQAQPSAANGNHLYPNVIRYQNQLIDTLKTPLTVVMRYELSRKKRIEQLGREHYLLNDMGNQNLGVRFGPGNKSEIYEGLRDGNGTSILIDGTVPVELIAQDVNPQNARSYLYRIIQNNNKELVGWSIPSSFRTTVDGKFQYAALGKFAYQPEQLLRIEIYNVKNYTEQDAITIDWRKVVPAKVTAMVSYLSYHSPLPDNGLFSRGLFPMEKKISFMRKGKMVPLFPPDKDFIQSRALNDLRICLGDSLQTIVFDINNGQRIYNYKVTLKREVDGHTDSINLAETNTRFYLYKEYWKQPGKYQVTFTPKIHRHGGEPITLLRNMATSISFTVLPALNVAHSVSVILLLVVTLVIICIAGMVLIYYRSRQKRVLAQEAQNRQIVTLQLQSVRAQLNPHFIFNALAGIQNLMNKNEVENANKYLARFARLTRNVLDEGNKELTSIEKETELLNDYLQMERMRFGFQFTIHANEPIIDQQIEIPAMLLQPFVENAVKHGVSALKDQGIITINIEPRDSDLLLTVHDNGKGFKGEQNTGMGIRLCEERIKLLNAIYKNTAILLNKSSDETGTLISIELKNWL